jgi:hypothetical protein
MSAKTAIQGLQVAVHVGDDGDAGAWRFTHAAKRTTRRTAAQPGLAPGHVLRHKRL